MPINNTALFDAAFAAVANSNEAWLSDPNAVDYLPVANVAVAIATEIDSQIPVITLGATISQRLLMNSTVKNVMAGRNPTAILPSAYASIASAIAGLFNEFSTKLQSSES